MAIGKDIYLKKKKKLLFWFFFSLEKSIEQLIDIDGEDNTNKITRFANYLRIVLPGTDPQVSELAAKALGFHFLSFSTIQNDNFNFFLFFKKNSN